MSVNSTQNIDLLFELLQSVVKDNNFSIDDNELRDLIISKCYYQNIANPQGSISDINKTVLDTCFVILEKNYNVNNTRQSLYNKPNNIQEVNDKDLLQNRAQEFDNNFKIAKENFDSMIKLKKPEEIKFEDEEEEVLPAKSLQTIMNQTLADREAELKQITKKYSKKQQKKAESWINENKEPSNTESNDNVKLKIVEETTNLKKKKVTFQDQVNKNNDFNTNILSRLKKKSNNNEINNQSNNSITINNNIIENLHVKLAMLDSNQKIILENQKKILSLLENNNNEKKQSKSLDLRPL